MTWAVPRRYTALVILESDAGSACLQMPTLAKSRWKSRNTAQSTAHWVQYLIDYTQRASIAQELAHISTMKHLVLLSLKRRLLVKSNCKILKSIIANHEQLAVVKTKLCDWFKAISWHFWECQVMPRMWSSFGSSWTASCADNYLQHVISPLCGNANRQCSPVAVASFSHACRPLKARWLSKDSLSHLASWHLVCKNLGA